MSNKILKTFAVILIVNLAGALAWWWFYGTIQSASLRVGGIRSEISAAENKQIDIKKLEETLLEISSKKEKMEKVFVGEKEIVRFIEDLEGLASASNVSLEILSASLPAREDEIGPRFSLSLEADFGELFKFFSALEKMNYQLDIETARFAFLDSEGWGLRASLRLVSYKF